MRMRHTRLTHMFGKNWSRMTVLTENSTPLESTNRETQILQHLLVQIHIEILVGRAAAGGL